MIWQRTENNHTKIYDNIVHIPYKCTQINVMYIQYHVVGTTKSRINKQNNSMTLSTSTLLSNGSTYQSLGQSGSALWQNVSSSSSSSEEMSTTDIWEMTELMDDLNEAGLGQMSSCMVLSLARHERTLSFLRSIFAAKLFSPSTASSAGVLPSWKRLYTSMKNNWKVK